MNAPFTRRAGHQRHRGARALAGVLLGAALTGSIIRATAPAVQASDAPSAWDGVFTADQAARGRTLYEAQCARCHGETLGGGENSPALVDDVFFTFWAGKSVGDLVEYTRTTMPSDGPGRISRKHCVDLAAYLLSANGFPAGAAELPTGLDALGRITIRRTR